MINERRTTSPAPAQQRPQCFGQIVLDKRTARALAAAFHMSVGELRGAVAQLEARGLMQRSGNRMWSLTIPSDGSRS
jgi:hypothetical protein